MWSTTTRYPTATARYPISESGKLIPPVPRVVVENPWVPRVENQTPPTLWVKPIAPQIHVPEKTVPRQLTLCHCQFYWNINWCCATTKYIPNSELICRNFQPHFHSHTRCKLISRKTKNVWYHPSWDCICIII